MAKFHIYEDKKGEYRWRLVARNGRVMADSAEGYNSQLACEQALNKFRELAALADIILEEK